MLMHGANSVQTENCAQHSIADPEIDWGDYMLVEKMYVRCPADKESVSDPRVFVCGQVIKVDSFIKEINII